MCIQPIKIPFRYLFENLFMARQRFDKRHLTGKNLSGIVVHTDKFQITEKPDRQYVTAFTRLGTCFYTQVDWDAPSSRDWERTMVRS